MTQNDADDKYIPYEKIGDDTADDDKKCYKVCIDADRNRYIESKEKVINFIMKAGNLLSHHKQRA